MGPVIVKSRNDGKLSHTPGRHARLLIIAALLLIAALAACARRPPVTDLTLALSWFRYLDAGELRDDCKPDGPERYRIAYNGVFQEQIRSYDVAVEADGTARVAMRVRGPLAAEPAPDLGDPQQPWRGMPFRAHLSASDMAGLRAALAESGAFDEPPPGIVLRARGFYWVVAACRQGGFSYNAWSWPGPRFDALRFAPVLLAADPSGVPVNPPRSRDAAQTAGETQLRVGRQGLVGLVAAF